MYTSITKKSKSSTRPANADVLVHYFCTFLLIKCIKHRTSNMFETLVRSQVNSALTACLQCQHLFSYGQTVVFKYLKFCINMFSLI